MTASTGTFAGWKGWLASGLVVLLGACGEEPPPPAPAPAAPAVDGREVALRARVTWTQQLINRTAGNAMLAESLAATASSGGDITTFIVANAPGEGIVCYRSGEVDRPWCIGVYPGSGDGEYIIEGYGENLSKPLFREKARAVWPR